MAATQDQTFLPNLEKSDSHPNTDLEKATSTNRSSLDIAPYVEQRQAEEAKDATSFWGKLAAFTIRLSKLGVETRG